MSDQKWSIPKLDGSNWMTWKFQMEHMLLDQELWGYVDGTMKLEDARDAEARALFKKKSQKALTAIIMATATSRLHIIQMCKEPADAWKRLQDQFQKGTLAMKLNLRKKYFRLELTEGTPMERHLREMNEITDLLSAMGSETSEEDRVMTLLGSLPSCYGPLVTTLGLQIDRLSWSDVQHTLLDEEARRKGPSQSTESRRNAALVGAQLKKPQRKKTYSFACHRCGVKGHFQRDCPKKKSEDGGRPSQGPQRPSHKAQIAGATYEESEEDVFRATIGEVSSTKKEGWLIDSGASCHMTWDRTLLSNYSEFEKRQKVGLGDGASVDSHGVGNVRATMLFGKGRSSRATFTEVLYVPGLASNLFSVRAVTTKGHTVTFVDEECKILTKEGRKLLGKGHMNGKLYRLDCKTSVGKSYTTLANSSMSEADPSRKEVTRALPN